MQHCGKLFNQEMTKIENYTQNQNRNESHCKRDKILIVLGSLLGHTFELCGENFDKMFMFVNCPLHKEK